MKTLCSALLSALIVTISASAASTTCVQSTLSTYLGYADGCVVGDKFFSNFSFTATGDGAPTGAQVTVTPDDVEPLGLAFASSNWNLEGGQKSQTTTITYLVTIFSGNDMISGATLGVGSVAPQGNGAATITKLLCPGGAYSPGCADLATLSGTFTPTSTIPFTASTALTLVNQVGVQDTIYLTTGANPGKGHKIAVGGYVSNQFNQTFVPPTGGVPEPLSWLFVSSGLLALGLLGRRIRKS